MKPASAKQKGRTLCKYLIEKIREYFPQLKEDDISYRSSGANGEDLLLSPSARAILPLSFECKNRKSFAIYKDYAQAEENCKGFEPVLVIRQNRSEPLAVVDLEFFLDLMKMKDYDTKISN